VGGKGEYQYIEAEGRQKKESGPDGKGMTRNSPKRLLRAISQDETNERVERQVGSLPDQTLPGRGRVRWGRRDQREINVRNDGIGIKSSRGVS